MTSKTVVQYTPEQTQSILEQYAAGVTVEAIATAVGKSARSVIAKLSREGVYQAKAKASASERVTKAQLIDLIAARLGVPAEKLESLEKATKEALALVVEATAV